MEMKKEKQTKSLIFSLACTNDVSVDVKWMKERFLKYKPVNFSYCIQGSSGSEDKQQQMVPKIVGSISPYARNLLSFFMQYIAGKFRKC